MCLNSTQRGIKRKEAGSSAEEKRQNSFNFFAKTRQLLAHCCTSKTKVILLFFFCHVQVHLSYFMRHSKMAILEGGRKSNSNFQCYSIKDTIGI